MKSKLKPKGHKFDGKSRVSNDTYRKNWDKIFKKNLEGSVINLEESFTSKDFYEETQKEYSPVSKIGHIEVKDEMPKLPFMVLDKEEPSNDKEVRSEVVKPELIPQPKNKDENIQPYNIDHNDLINYLIHKRNITEGFTNQNNTFKNVNDGFNDVLLFALFGIFFLIFTDYIYKLGKKSY